MVHFSRGARYNGTANLADAAVDLAVDSAGNAVVAGYSSSSDADAITFLLDRTTGGVLWSRRYVGPRCGRQRHGVVCGR